LNVRSVPEAEVNPGILNGSYRESRPSDSAWQLRLSAHKRRSSHSNFFNIEVEMERVAGLFVALLS
jgi:hypothetical protein